MIARHDYWASDVRSTLDTQSTTVDIYKCSSWRLDKMLYVHVDSGETLWRVVLSEQVWHSGTYLSHGSMTKPGDETESCSVGDVHRKNLPFMTGDSHHHALWRSMSN